MLSDLYSDRILKAASLIPPARRLGPPAATAKRTSRVCGSEVVVDMLTKDDVVSQFGIEARACALGQASASIVARNIVGAAPREIFRLRDEMRAMLKENGAPPTGARWADFEAFAALRDYPERHASIMLVFEAAADCLEQLERNDPYTELNV